jgi:hypothetical protein
MKVYIASSFRNLNAVMLLRDCFRGQGHTVLDWTDKTPPLPAAMPLAERREALDADERGAIFDFCTHACGSADLVVYLGPAGQDAAAEVGIAWAAGVPVFGFAGPLEKPGLILNRCVAQWFTEFEPFWDAVQDVHFKLTNPDMEEK